MIIAWGLLKSIEARAFHTGLRRRTVFRNYVILVLVAQDFRGRSYEIAEAKRDRGPTALVHPAVPQHPNRPYTASAATLSLATFEIYRNRSVPFGGLEVFLHAAPIPLSWFEVGV